MKNRYLLDTNILVFIVTGEIEEINRDVYALMSDYENLFEISTISVMELIQLHRIGKVRLKRGESVNGVLEKLEDETGIKIVPFNAPHTKTLSNLDIVDGHNDPFDHAIISQAITDRYTLISSDSKFKHYRDQNLNFVFNKR